jgi:hypothetical protein
MFSACGGAVALLGAGWIADTLDLGAHVMDVRVVSIGLLVWADVLVVAARLSRRHLFGAVAVIIAGDLAWCLGSAALVGTGEVSSAGGPVVVAIAIVVGGFALVQSSLLVQAIRAGGAPEDRSEAIERRFALPAGPAISWAVLTDHDLYGQIAPNLRSVVARSANGPGLTRVCTDRAGRAWPEECTLWVEEKVYEVTVDPEAHPAPVAALTGRFWIEPLDRHRTRLGMRFAFLPEPGFRGLMFATTMSFVAPLLIAVIRRRWRVEARRRVATRP